MNVMRDQMESASHQWITAMMDQLDSVKESAESYISAEIEGQLEGFEPDVSSEVEYHLERGDFMNSDGVYEMIRDYVQDHDLQEEDEVKSLIEDALEDFRRDLIDDVVSDIIGRLDPTVAQKDKEIELLKIRLQDTQLALDNERDRAGPTAETAGTPLERDPSLPPSQETESNGGEQDES
jgi:hypothetical protein